jgi:hypothetical protein
VSAAVTCMRRFADATFATGTPTPAQRPLIVLSKKRAGSPGFSSSAPASTTGAFKKARTNTRAYATAQDQVRSTDA